MTFDGHRDETAAEPQHDDGEMHFFPFLDKAHRYRLVRSETLQVATTQTNRQNMSAGECQTSNRGDYDDVSLYIMTGPNPFSKSFPITVFVCI